MKTGLALKVCNLNGLSDRVLQYQKTGEGYPGILKDASLIVYRYPRTKYGWSVDECSQFYLFFFRRLNRMFKRYHDMGKGFESYLCSAIKWQMNNFIRKNLEIRRRWRYGYEKEFWTFEENEALENESDFMQFFELDRYGRIKKSIMRRGYLLYVLKNCLYITDKDIETASRLTGLGKKKLEILTERIRNSLQNKLDKLSILRMRRNRAYYRLKFLTEDLRNSRDSFIMQKLKDRVEKAKKTMMNAHIAISRIKLSPSNRELAEILGIPKGTVDTSLGALKKFADDYFNLVNKRRA